MIRLAPLRKDLVKIAANWRNQDISGLRTPFFLTYEMQEEFYRDVICNRNSCHRYYALEATNKKGSIFVGMGGITNIQWENGIGEISLIINPDFRRMGYGKGCADVLFDHAFSNLRLHTVCGEYYHCNVNRRFWAKYLEQNGAYSVILKNRKYHEGKYNDSTYFSISR